MEVRITDYRSQFNLSDKTFSHFVVLELPTGESVVAEITEAAASRIIEITTGVPSGEANTQPESKPVVRSGDRVHVTQQTNVQNGAHTVAPSMPIDQTEEPIIIEWANLSDEYIDRNTKAALIALNTPAKLPGQALQNLITNIHQTFTNEDWARVLGQPTPAPPIQPPQPSLPQVGMVTWENTPINTVVSNGPQAVTVPKDAFGYPVIPGTARVEVDGDEEEAGQV